MIKFIGSLPFAQSVSIYDKRCLEILKVTLKYTCCPVYLIDNCVPVKMELKTLFYSNVLPMERSLCFQQYWRQNLLRFSSMNGMFNYQGFKQYFYSERQTGSQVCEIAVIRFCQKKGDFY